MNKKSVKNLEISVTYSVGLSDVEIEERVLNALLSACDKGEKRKGEAKNEEEKDAGEGGREKRRGREAGGRVGGLQY